MKMINKKSVWHLPWTILTTIAVGFSLSVYGGGFSQFPDSTVTNWNGEVSSFRVSYTNVNGYPITYSWTLDGNPIAGSSSTEYDTTWTLAQAGLHTIVCTLSSGGDVVNVATWNVTVKRRLYVDASSTASSPTGADRTSAFGNIYNAFENSQDGDVIWVLPGSYYGFYPYNENRIVVVAAEGVEKTTISSEYEYDPVCVYGYDTNLTTVVGFTLSGSGAMYATLRNCVITGCVARSDYYYGGYSCFEGARLENCLVTHNQGACLFQSATLLNCTVVDNDVVEIQDMYYYGGMPLGVIGPYTYVYNSIVRFNYDEDGYEANIADVSSTWGASAQPKIYYSCIYPQPTVGSNNVTSDPCFADALFGDYRLYTGSPCIDAGNSAYVSFDVDYAGSNRVVGASVDMGCYEGAVTLPAPVTPTGVSVGNGVAAEGVIVTWDAMPGAKQYVVYRAESNDVSIAEIVATVEHSKYEDLNTIVGARYWYFIKAMNDSGESGISAGESGYRVHSLSILTTNLYPVVAGLPFETLLTATGGVPSYAWSPCTNVYDYTRTTSDSTFTNTNNVGIGLSSSSSDLMEYQLPFAFPFGGVMYESLYISSYGAVVFGAKPSYFYPEEFRQYVSIAPLFGYGSGYGDVYIERSDTHEITFRWHYENHYYAGYDAEDHVNYALTLTDKGLIRFSYGSRNDGYGGFVGLSFGDGIHYQYEMLYGEPDKNHDVVFRPNTLPDGIAIDTDGRIAGRLLDVGEYRFKATVEDSLGNCKEDIITLTVVDNPNLHPVATNFLPTASTVVVRPDADNVFKVEASDPEGLPLTWTWLIDGVTNCVTITPEFNYHPDELFGGAHTLTCIVSDGFWHDRVNKRWTIVVPKWYVASTGSSSNSGNCFSNAFASIQTAIDRADAGDVIYVASGVYSPVSTGNKSITILSAHDALSVIDGSGKSRCVNVGSGASLTNTVFCGFTIRNGYVAGDGAGALGGTFKNCIIHDCCTANGTYYGGGVAYGTLYNCQINDNQACSAGGGVYNAILYNCTVVGNKSRQTPGISGGTRYNTICWDNTLDDGITPMGNDSVDPELVYDDGIYRLYADSPCIDAGTASYVFEQNDLVGGARVQGTAIDKGAVEGGVAGCYVKTGAQGAGKSSASVCVPSGDHVVISATQFDDEHQFIGFYVAGSLLDGVVSSGRVHQVVFAPAESTSAVTAVFEDRTFHVATDGDDSRDGRSWATAKRTIAGAVQYAKSGDVVLVGDGVYDRFSLTSNHFVTIRSVNGYANTVIDGFGTNSCAVLGYNSSCVNTVLEGFTLRNGYASNGGGASYGTIRRCFLTDNTASSPGGGLYYGVAENCVFWRNRSSNYGGGTAYSTLVNCTVYENTSASSGGGTYYGTAYNSIIVKNSGGEYYYSSCYACYTSGDPLFVYSADGDFRLRAGSPCLNIGTDSYVRGEVDIMGAPRIQDRKVDAGACEGVAIGYVIGTKVIGHGDVSPCYLLLSEGQNGCFSAASEERPFFGFSTNGIDIIERGTNFVWQNTIADGTLYVHFATNIYVNSLIPDDSGDGFTPASAKRTLQNAVSLAKTGETIYVADGIYDSVSTSNKSIRVIAEGGWEKTIIDGGGSNRCVFVGSGSTDTNSMFYGFTLRNGYANGNGAGAMGGRFDNCVIENCRSQGSYYGGGTYYALLNNCLVRRNSAAYGGGIAYGTIGNCTVVDNVASSQGGGTYQGTIRNSIVWGNVGSNSYSNRYSGTFTYSCTFPSVSGTGNISANPYFTDVAGGDYRLRQYSPCLDVGNNSYVVGNEDLSCTNRVVDGRVDMGCYEGWVYLPEPASIVGLSAEDGRRIGSVRLTWKADEYARSYTIYRAETNIVDAFETLASTASCFYDDETAIPGVTYWYRVAGVNPTGVGPASEMDSGWCLGEMTFAANELETAIAGLPYSAHLSISGGAGGYVWKSGADDYDVVYGDSTYLVDDCRTTGVSGDDVCVSYPLPFDFPFFGRAYNKVWVNSNGTLTFDGEYNGYAAALSLFTNRVMIAAFWKDLRTGSAGVGVSTNGGDSITFLWNNASYYSGGAAVNASVTLYSDGTVLCSYGSGNASGAFVGVSAGDGVHFRYVNLVGTSLANYDDIRFVPQDVPGGLTLAADGTLSGIAAAPGTYTFTVFVTDSYGNGATQKITLEVETNPNLRTVQFELGAYGVRGGGGDLLQYVMLGEDATAPTVRSRAGWVFDGWNRSFTNISENISVSAKYRSAYADLHVDAIDVTNMVASGESLDLRWIVGNTGNPSFNGRMTERISLVSVSDENVVRVIASPTFEGVVERDGSIERNLAIDVPLKGWEGTWYVRIQTGINPTMQEYAANNVTTTVEMVEITAVPLPNLKANAVSGDANLVPGESALFSFATTNSGAAAASAPWMDCIYLESVDSGIAVKVGDISRTNDLDSASAINGEYSLTIPEFISVAGAVRVKVVADANGDVVESDDDDNVAYSVGTFSLATNLYLTAASTSVYENVSGSGVRFTVRRSGPTTEAMTVVLSATLGGSPASATVNCPESVTIPAGSVSTVFYVKPIDNATVEGPRTITVSALTDDCRPASLALTILDNEVPKLTVTLDKASIREGDGDILATVTRELVTDEPLTVYLTGASTSRCSYPSSVTIPAGEASVTFEISVPNNDIAQAAASLTLRASSSGYTSTSVSYMVEDDDVPGVTLSLTPEVVSEGAGAQAIYATLTRSDTNQITQAVRVRLTASEANQLILPSEITIPKYTMAVRFAVGVVDNALDDGDREVTINGAIVIESCGCNGQPSNGDVIQAVVGIIDNDGPALALKADPTTMKEGFDPAGYLVLSHNSTLTEDLTVRLWVDAENEDEIVIPETVTIHAGETSVRIPVATLDDGVEDGGQLVSVYVEDESDVFAPSSTWVQVSDQNLPDLTVAKIETVSSVVAMENFTASVTVTNTGFMATSKAVPYAVHLVKGASANAISSATLVKSGTLTSGIDIGDALYGTVTLTAPEMPGDYRVAVVVDPDGTISELDSANNTGWSSAIGVTVAYTATAGVDKKVYMPGETVTITGVVSRADGTTAGNVQIDPYVMLSGMRRSLRTTTAADGSYSTVFTPTSGEAGDYTVGACYPGVNSKVAQDSFSIIGMKRSSTANVIWDIALGDSATRTVTIQNRSAVPLTGLTITFTDVPEECGFTYSLPDTIPANGSVALSMTATADGLTDQVDYRKFYAHLTVDEGLVLDFPLYFHSQAQRAYLRATPTSINTTMAIGHTRYIEVTVVNDGKGDSGAVTVSVPSVNWLRVVSGASIDNLASGESATVTLAVSPTAEDGLTLNSPLSGGKMAVNCANGTGCSVSLKFTPVSEAMGSITVDAVDNNTYYLDSQPHLSNATVCVSNPYTGETVATGKTGTDGIWTMDGIPEGTYQLTITAPNHDTHADALIIEPGRNTVINAFLQSKVVSVSWTVEKVEIEDAYDIQLLLDFETQVPAPIVNVTMPDEMPILNKGESYAFNINVENTGVIAAEKVTITMPEIKGHIFVLSDNNIYVPAKSAVTIAAVFKRNGSSPSGGGGSGGGEGGGSGGGEGGGSGGGSGGGEGGGSGGGSGGGEGGGSGGGEGGGSGGEDDDPPGGDPPGGDPPGGDPPGDKEDDDLVVCFHRVQIDVEYRCGVQYPLYGYERILRHGKCNSGEIPLDDRNSTWRINPTTQPIGDPTRGSGGGVNGGSPGTFANGVAAVIQRFLCFLGSPCAQSLLNCGVNILGGLDPSGLANDAMLGQSCATAYQSVEEGDIAAIRGFVDCSASIISAGAKHVQQVGLGLGAAGGVAVPGVGIVPGAVVASVGTIALWGSIGSACLVDIADDCIIRRRFVPREMERSRLLKSSTDEELLEISLDNAAECYFGEIGAITNIIAELSGDASWSAKISIHQAKTFFDAFNNALGNDYTVTVENFGDLIYGDLTQNDIQKFVSRWNRSVEKWKENGLTFEAEGCISLLTYMKYAQDYLSYDEQAKLRGYDTAAHYLYSELREMIEEYMSQSGKVCASVQLELSQTLAMTREAFDGTLTMYNGNTTTPITNLKLELSVLDEEGNECKDLFEMFANGTSGDMSDGSALAGGLSVSAGGTGSAMVRFIPERGAAPTEEKLYRFGGTVTYTDPFSGETATVKLTPVTLTVSPSPYLHLDYFVQRDVFADDPFTPDVVEASMPAELAVLVRNIGGGNANKVTIASAQPEMVQNEKGLSAAFNLKDYTLEASALNGATAHLGLNTVSLGTIEPNESKVAQWWLTSTIEGHFIGMSATVTPVNSWNTPDTMLVDPDVDVHKLVRSIVADGDTLPDFLVCDGSDLYGTPNEIYTAVGDQLPVYVASVASSATLPAGGEIALPLTLTPARSGWNYGYAMIPGIFRYTISRIVRGDGTEISLRNAWITDRTFRDGNTPLLEDRLHVVDEFTSGAAQAYTVYLSAKPSDVPEVVAFEGVTDGSIEYAARNAVTVVFSKPIDPATFTYNSLTLMKQGSYLNDLSALTITAADDSGTRFTIGNLSALCGGLGRYELTVQCAGIADTVGQLGTVGKSVAWTYATAEAPYVIGADGVPVRRVQSLDTISVTFSAPIKPETFTSAALRMNNVAVGSGVNIAALDASGTRFSVSGLSAAQTADGEYTLAVDATAVAGLDDTPGINTYTATWTRDTVAPVLQSLTHADGLNGTEFTLTFSEEVESESLTPNKATLKRNNSVVALPNNASLRRVGDAASCQWVLSGIDSALAEDGTYELCFSADGVTDEAGNVASGSKSVSWTVDRTPPAQITDLAISPDGGFSDTDGITYTGALAVSGTLQEAGLTVEIVAKYVGGGETVLATLPTAGGDTLPAGAFSQNIVMPGTGNATLIVRLTDAAGNSSDSEKSVSVDGIALTGTLTGASDDEGVVTTTATLAFSAKPMEADVTFDKFALTRDGEAVALEGVTFAKVDDTTFALTGLDSLCSEDGVYVLTFNGAAVRKYTSGLLMSGSLVMRWRYENPDREPPTVMDVLFDGETPHEAYTNVFSSVSVTFSEAVNVPELIENGLIGRAARIDLLDAANAVTGSAAVASAMTWDGESNTLSWQIDPLAVPAGRTRLMLDAGLIADFAGNHLAADGYAVTNGMRTYMQSETVLAQVNAQAMPMWYNGELYVGEKTADNKGKIRHYAANGTWSYLQSEGVDIEIPAQGCQGVSLAFADMDGDGVAETYVGTATGDVLKYPGGTAIASLGANRAMPYAYDIDGDGCEELVTGGMDGRIRVISRDAATGTYSMTVLTDVNGAALTVPNGRAAPIVADINHDGIADIVSGDTAGNVLAYLGAGGSPSSATATDAQERVPPVFVVTPVCVFTNSVGLADRSRLGYGDANGDGIDDLIVGRSDGSVVAMLGAETPSPIVPFAVKAVVSASAGAHGAIAPVGDATYDGGDTPEYRMTPDVGYHVVDVKIDGVSIGAANNYVFAPLTTSHAIYADFAIDTFAVTFEAGAHGALSSATAQTIDYGATSAVPGVTPDAGYEFTGWSGDVTAPVVSNVTFTAQYATIPYAITYTGLKGATNPNPLTYTVEDEVTFAAPGDVYGWVFKGWSPASIALGSNGDVEASANWERQKFDVTANGETSQCSYEDEVTFATNVVVNAGAKQYVCKGWAATNAEPSAGDGASAEFKVLGDVLFVWLWETNMVTLAQSVNSEDLEWATGGAAGWMPEWSDTASDGLHQAFCERVSNGTNAWIATTVEGAGTISFKWRSSLASRNTKYQFMVDGEVKGMLTGTNEWNEVSVSVFGDRTHEIKWRLMTGRSGASGNDWVALDAVDWTSSVPPTLAEALNTNLVWTTDGDVAWHGVARESLTDSRDAWAVVSGLGDDGTSYIHVRVYGSGVLSFDWAISCEEDYDWMELTVDGEVRDYVSGDMGWTRSAVGIVGDGWHVISWEYIKDELDDPELAGENVAKLDNVVWSPDDIDPIPPLVLESGAELVNLTVEGVGFADERVKETIGGSAEEYTAFKTWAESVKGTTGNAQAGEAAVVASPHAAAAYLLGAERLFANAPTVEIGEVSVGDGESAGTTAMSIAVTVKDGESVVAVNAAKVKAMFEATGDLGDWNGAAKLTPEVTVEEGDGATMRFKVTPGDGTAPRAFLRIRK